MPTKSGDPLRYTIVKKEYIILRKKRSATQNNKGAKYESQRSILRQP